MSTGDWVSSKQRGLRTLTNDRRRPCPQMFFNCGQDQGNEPITRYGHRNWWSLFAKGSIWNSAAMARHGCQGCLIF